MMHRVFALCAGLLLLGLMPGSTLAAVPSNLDYSNAVVTGYTWSSQADLAQTFTAGKSGRLSGVDLWLGGTGTIQVSINATASSLPAGAHLVTASGTASNPAGWVHFSFPTPPMVTSGTQYAIVFNTGKTATVDGSPNNYAGGQALMNKFGFGWAPITDPDRPDWAFQTYVDTVTTVSEWDKASITAGATTPLTLTVTMTFHNGVEAQTYGVQVGGWPSWYTPQGSTCSSLQGADPAPVCTLKDLQINTLYVNASATGDTLTVIVTGTASPTLYEAGFAEKGSGHAWMYYTPDTVFLEAVGDATVQVVDPDAATPTPPPAATPTPTPRQSLQGSTLPPTSAGVGSGSGGTGSTIWLLPIGLLAFLGGAFALVIRRRRLA